MAPTEIARISLSTLGAIVAYAKMPTDENHSAVIKYGLQIEGQEREIKPVDVQLLLAMVARR